MKNYSDDVIRAKALIKNADALVIGVGSGLTAAGGLNYADPALAEKWYPEYAAQGQHSIMEIMGSFWPNTLQEKNATVFWGFWARHIWHIRYEANVLLPYVDLFTLAHSKDYFIVTTNVDGQLEKAGFPKDKIFAPQGDYALFQCSVPCSDAVYPNREMVQGMVAHMPTPFEIRPEAPHCPKCGALMAPNLRCDHTFVEAPHMKNMGDYETFIKNRRNKRLVFLELGVGFNTPGIIRFPFEQMAGMLPKATLVRINRDDVRTMYDLGGQGIFLQSGLANVLQKLK